MSTERQDLIDRCKRHVALFKKAGWDDEENEVREARKAELLIKLLGNEDVVYKAADISPRSTAVYVVHTDAALKEGLSADNLFFVLLASELDELEASYGLYASRISKVEHDSLHR